MSDVCQYCGYKASTKSALTRHINTAKYCIAIRDAVNKVTEQEPKKEDTLSDIINEKDKMIIKLNNDINALIQDKKQLNDIINYVKVANIELHNEIKKLSEENHNLKSKVKDQKIRHIKIPILHMKFFYKELEDVKFFESNKTIDDIAKNIIPIMKKYTRLTDKSRMNYAYFKDDSYKRFLDNEGITLLDNLSEIALKYNVNIISSGEDCKFDNFIYRKLLLDKITGLFIRGSLMSCKNNLELVSVLNKTQTFEPVVPILNDIEIKDQPCSCIPIRMQVFLLMEREKLIECKNNPISGPVNLKQFNLFEFSDTINKIKSVVRYTNKNSLFNLLYTNLKGKIQVNNNYRITYAAKNSDGVVEDVECDIKTFVTTNINKSLDRFYDKIKKILYDVRISSLDSDKYGKLFSRPVPAGDKNIKDKLVSNEKEMNDIISANDNGIMLFKSLFDLLK